jgi:fatty-acyl-CoA synthase
MSALHTLDHWIRDRAASTPERIAIDYLGRETRYVELDDRSERIAAQLLAAGLQHGDRVATLTGNSPEHVAVFFACAKAGLVLVPLNWRLSPVELAYQLDDSDAAVLMVEAAYEALARGALEAALTPCRVLPLGAPAERASADEVIADDDPLLLVYTSGTTGKPKGAVLTHANCFWTNLGLDLATPISADDVVLQLLPQFHCGGWNVQPLLAWWKGARVVLERSFDAGRCLRLIGEKRVTTMMGVPAIYQFMAQAPGFEEADLSSLRMAVVGGAPMPELLLELWQQRGVAIVQGYGLTEAAPNVLCVPPEQAVRKQGYAGKPYPHVAVELRDPETGAAAAGAATGELVVRGPNVFAGYWGNPGATAEVLVDGWLYTGDIAERDAEGFYRICGRLKDMYISGGENVYPAEVENVLLAHADVTDAAVVGVPSERWGEAGVAFVVLDERAATTDEELTQYCRSRLAKYKVPQAIRFLPELPRSAMNKVLKGELLAEWTTEVRS